jgi:oligopeptide transport system substrate-binding protein
LKQWYGEDVAEAKRLLAEAGYPDGFDGGKLLNAPGGSLPDQVALLADMLKRTLNIALTLDIPEYAIGYDRFQKSDFTIAYGVYARSYPDPDDYLHARYRTGASRNYGSCSDPKLDQMLDEQRSITAQAKRNALIEQIDHYFVTDVICAIQMPSTTDYWPYWPFVKGFSQHISFGGPEFANTWLDQP